MSISKQSFIKDLTQEQISTIEGRMRPGNYSHAGFLGQDQSLIELIEGDAKVLEELGITYNQIADRLDSLTGQAFRKWELAVRGFEDYFEARKKGALIDGFLNVYARGWEGDQVCPFFNEGRSVEDEDYSRIPDCGMGSHDFAVKNERQGTIIRFPELMSHLVRDHHFFEGDTPYRLDPKEAVEVLELKPGVDYSPKFEKEMIWDVTFATNNINDDSILARTLVESPEKTVDITPETRMYIAGNNGLIICKKYIKLNEILKVNGTEDVILRYIYPGQTLIERTESKYIVG